MRIRAILLDVDGVLVEPMVFAKVLEAEHGLTPDDTASFFRGAFVRCLLRRADLKSELPGLCCCRRAPA
jgi:hypothetical protein